MISRANFHVYEEILIFAWYISFLDSWKLFCITDCNQYSNFSSALLRFIDVISIKFNDQYLTYAFQFSISTLGCFQI